MIHCHGFLTPLGPRDIPIRAGFEEVAGARMDYKEPFDLGPQFRPARAGFVEICRSLLGSG